LFSKIGHFEVNHLVIAVISDLSGSAAREQLVTAGPTFENYEYRSRLIAFANQIMTARNILRFAARRVEKLDILSRQRCISTQLVDESVRHVPLLLRAKVKASPRSFSAPGRATSCRDVSHHGGICCTFPCIIGRYFQVPFEI
jgi:hypothetical protein